MPRDKKQTHIFITAGESSGDSLGSRLMKALRKESGGHIQFSGVGGPLMEKEGLESIFPMNDLSVMGLFEVLPRINKLLKRINQTAEKIKEISPSILITIDSPDFSFRVAKKVHEKCKTRPNMFHYVAPTVWAWRPERAQKLATLYDGVMCLYPFEPPYFEKEGMQAAFIGHSVMESGYDKADGPAFRKRNHIPEDAPVLGLFFGSRMGELNRVAPYLREAAFEIAKEKKEIHIVSPTVKHLEKQARNLLESMPCPVHAITDPEQKWDAFAAMDFAIATSGTVGLELAIADIPHVIAYKTGHLTWEIARRKLFIKYAHLANILLDREVVPEFIQKECRAGPIKDAVKRLLDDPKMIAEQKQDFAEIRTQITGTEDTCTSSTQAARFVLEKAYSRSSIGT